MYEYLKEQWALNFVTVATLKKYVKLEAKKPGAGITEGQYQEITGEPYEG